MGSLNGIWAVLLAVAGSVAPAQSAGASASPEAFCKGMTVSFTGMQPLNFRIKVDAPIPLENLYGQFTQGHLLPIDLWVLSAEGNRVPVVGARLVEPGGRIVEPRQPGHWRVEIPKGGRWRLFVPIVGKPWRLWSAFHPFMVSLSKGVSVDVAGTGAVFLTTPKPGRVGIALERVRGSGKAVLAAPDGKAVAEAELGSGVALQASGQAGTWRLNLQGLATAELTAEGVLRWAAFVPWDTFVPGAPTLRIEGNPILAQGEPLDLRAIVTDPDDDVTDITWELPRGGSLHGSRLRMPVEWIESFKVRVVARDREGSESVAEMRVHPPPPHLRLAKDAILIQAENFTSQGGGRVLVANRSDNYGKMITVWHRRRNHWLEWEFKIDRPGFYEIYARYGSSVTPRRQLLIDGEVPHKAYEEIALAGTGGYGVRPRDWRSVGLGPPVRLATGVHRLRMINRHGEQRDGMALDYLLLVPVRSQEEAKP